MESGAIGRKWSEQKEMNRGWTLMVESNPTHPETAALLRGQEIRNNEVQCAGADVTGRCLRSGMK
jgi:hypothetical protein